MAGTDPTTVVDQFADAYNSGADDKLLSLCSEDIRVVHHNRDVTINGREEFAALLANFKGAFPDKQFGNRRGRYVDGDRVIVEHTWTATAAVDVPGWAKQGEVASLDLCTVYTIRDGLVVEYNDYG